MINWSTKKKWGLGMALSGLAAMVVGGFAIGDVATPEWLDLAFAAVGAVLNILGVSFVTPDEPPQE